MKCSVTDRTVRPLLWGSLLLCCLGCSHRGKHSDYLPAESKAREALEATLTAWQNGQPASEVKVGSAGIKVLDSKWQSGQKLAGYEIVKVEPDEQRFWFSVNLRTENPAAQEEVRYVVIGLDPLWVCREEDYHRMEGR